MKPDDQSFPPLPTPDGEHQARHPERVTTIIAQNGNAYVEGFSEEWGLWETYRREPTSKHRAATRASLSDKAIRFAHEHGAQSELVSPDGALLDTFDMHQPDAQEIQLDLTLSYRTNMALTPTCRPICANTVFPS